MDIQKSIDRLDIEIEELKTKIDEEHMLCQDITDLEELIDKAIMFGDLCAKRDAKAKAVPENKIEFDGEYIKYPNSYAIHCQFDEDFDCHIFDVYQNEDCVKDGMTQLKQAHLFVFSMSEAQEPTND